MTTHTHDHGDLPEVPEATGSAGTSTTTPEDVTEALKDVVDPELGINVVDLGLVYGVHIDPDTNNLRALHYKHILHFIRLPHSSLYLPRHGRICVAPTYWRFMLWIEEEQSGQAMRGARKGRFAGFTRAVRFEQGGRVARRCGGTRLASSSGNVRRSGVVSRGRKSRW